MTCYSSWFLMALPAFTGNMAPVVVGKLKLLKRFDRPIDSGRTFRGKRIFGDHKTLRGFIVGTAAAVLVSWGQAFLERHGLITLPVDFSLPRFLLFGFLAGFGALAGDALKSFFKRQAGIQSGRPFLPFDQIDYILGFLVFTAPLVSWTWQVTLFLLGCGMILNPLVNLTAYLFGIKKTYW